MTTHSQRGQREGVILAVLSTSVFMASLDLFIVNVAFHSIQHDFHGVSLSNLSWVLNGYAIVYAALLVPAGRLADRFGRRGAFLIGLAVFTVASAGSAVAPSLWPLVGFRLLQGAGAAILTPASLSLVLAAYPGPERRRAVRIWAATGALAAAAGPVVGGVLVQASWRLVFVVNLPIGTIALLISARVLLPARDPNATRLPDLPGAAVLAVAIGALALGLVKGADWGWGSTSTLGCLIGAALGVVLVAWRCRRHPVPVIEPAIVRVASFSWSNVTAVAFTAAFSANLLLVVLWLQQAWGWSPITTGLGVAPGPLMVIPFTVVANRVQGRVGSGALTALGCVLFAGGMALITIRLGLASDYAGEILPGQIITGAGVGLALPEILSAATSSLPPNRSATGSAVINMSRQVGSVLGVSIAIAIIGSPHSPLQTLNSFRDARWALTAASVVAAVAAIGMTPRRAERTAAAAAARQPA